MDNKKRANIFIILGIIVLVVSLGLNDGSLLSLSSIVLIICGCVIKSKEKEKITDELEISIDFDVTTNVDNKLYLDENKKKICIPCNNMIRPEMIFDYNDILKYELLEDGNSISKGGVGRAIIGGVLFGGVGAIVGGSTGHKSKQTCTRLQVKITLNDVDDPVKYIEFIDNEIRKDSLMYKSAYDSAQKVLSTLDVICNPNVSNGNSNDTLSSNSIPEQIKEYKELLDSGAITQEEYNKKKKQLLESDK